MVSPTSLAGGLTAAAALLILAPHVSALPAAAPSSVAPAVVASRATATPAVEATPEASAPTPAPEAVTTAAPDIRARAPGGVRPVNLQKTHIFDYYAAPAGYRGFGKNVGQGDWFSRKNLQKEMNRMRPDRFWKPRKYTPYDEYDGGPLNKRGEPEPEPEKVAEPETEQNEEQNEEQEQQVSKPDVLSKRGDDGEVGAAKPRGGWYVAAPPFFFGVDAYGPNYKDVYQYTTWDSPSEPGQFAKHRGRNWRRDAGEGEGEGETEAETPAAEPQEQQ